VCTELDSKIEKLNDILQGADIKLVLGLDTDQNFGEKGILTP